MARTIEERLGYLRDKIISKRVSIGLGIGVALILYNMIDWKKSYECRSAERRVINSAYCYSDYSKQYKPVAMHDDSVRVFGEKNVGGDK